MAHVSAMQIAAGQHIVNQVVAAGQSIQVDTFKVDESNQVTTIFNIQSGPLNLFMAMKAEEMRQLAIMLVDQSALHEGTQKYLRENYTAGGEKCTTYTSE